VTTTPARRPKPPSRSTPTPPIPTPVDGDWVSEGADGGWSELDQAHTDHDEDPGSETDSNLVLFPDEFPPLPLDDSSPSAPGLTSELNTDWASIPLDDQSALDSPDNLSLFTTDEPPKLGCRPPRPPTTVQDRLRVLQLGNDAGRATRTG
jgi:hypothetical protein